MKVILNKELYNKALKYYFFERNFFKRFLTVLLFSLFIATFNFGEPSFLWSLFFIKFFCLLVIIYLIIFLLPYLAYKVRPNEILIKDELDLEYKLFEDGIQISSRLEDKVFRWESINALYFINAFLFLELKNKKFYVIPTATFSSENELDQFISIINRKLRENFHKSFNRRHSRFRKIGWLGLIPFYGFFVGLFLILKGTKFQDKLLILIGILAVVFNIGLVGFMYYEAKYSPKSENANYVIAKEKLDMLVKDIESFKLIYSVYPDSLNQLTAVDKVPPVTDPFLQTTVSPFDKKTNIEFHYKKNGNKFSLFSVGRDHLPNTADDIYPAEDSSNIKK